MPILQGTHHTAIICSDYERSKSFYTKVLGLQIVNEAYRVARSSHKLDLQMQDGTLIELFSFPSPPPRPSYPEACGLRHLAFKVSDIEHTLREIRSHGIEAQEVRVDEFTGKRFAFIEDPDGLPIEFYEIPDLQSGEFVSPDRLTIGSFIQDLAIFDDARLLRPWTLLSELEPRISSHVAKFDTQGMSADIFVHGDALVEDGAVIKGPIYVSAGCFIASGAYLRGGVFLGENVRIGPGCEVKSSIIFHSSSLAHFNFIGDSIIGSRVNFEAGSHTANHWNERENKIISVRTTAEPIVTNCDKFGALVGDDCRIGANSVLSPGTLLARAHRVPRLSLVDQLG